MTELEREAEPEAERFDSGAEYHPVPLRNVREVRVVYRHTGRYKPRKHADVYASMLQGQEPLGAEFEAIWDANVAGLYES